MRSDTVMVDADESPQFHAGAVLDSILETCDREETGWEGAVEIAVDLTLEAVVDWLIEQGLGAQAEEIETARRLL